MAASIERIEPKTTGKFLFTSGSTGMPKAVINTQEMMCANLAMGQMSRTRKASDPPAVMLDWLPWNHTMGGNATFQGNLADGGTTYIDDGKPLPGLFEETLRNLREISPTYFANVPAGYAMLATALENDDALAKRFFKNLNFHQEDRELMIVVTPHLVQPLAKDPGRIEEFLLHYDVLHRIRGNDGGSENTALLSPSPNYEAAPPLLSRRAEDGLPEAVRWRCPSRRRV